MGKSAFLIFIAITAGVIFIWTILVFWMRFVSSLFYNTLGFNKHNTQSCFLAAMVITIIIVLIVWLLDTGGFIVGFSKLISK